MRLSAAAHARCAGSGPAACGPRAAAAVRSDGRACWRPARVGRGCWRSTRIWTAFGCAAVAALLAPARTLDVRLMRAAAASSMRCARHARRGPPCSHTLGLHLLTAATAAALGAPREPPDSGLLLSAVRTTMPATGFAAVGAAIARAATPAARNSLVMRNSPFEQQKRPVGRTVPTLKRMEPAP